MILIKGCLKNTQLNMNDEEHTKQNKTSKKKVGNNALEKQDCIKT